MNSIVTLVVAIVITMNLSAETIRLQSTDYKIRFESDSANVNEMIKLSVWLIWAKKDGQLKITDFRLPVKPWYKFEGGGSSTGEMGADSSYFKLDFNLLFNQSGRFQIHPIEVYYSYDSMSFGKLSGSSPEILISGPQNETMFNYLKLHMVLFGLMVLFFVIIVWSYWKIRSQKSLPIVTNEGSEISEWQLLRQEMDQLFSDKKMNYRTSLNHLEKILDKIPASAKSIDTDVKIRKMLKAEKNKNFVSFNTFETIYYAILQIIDEQIQNELNGGVYDNGYSEN